MRVLFTCLPGFGHFNPLVPLARAVVAAGHEVAFATGGDLCPRVERAGFTAFAAGLPFREQMDEAARRYPDAHALPPGTERFEQFVPLMLAGVAAPARADDLVPIVETWRPDVIVHDEAEFGAPVAATVAGLPYASHSIVLLRPWSMARLTAETLAPLCRRWGVDLGRFGGLYRYLHFDACPPSLQAPHIAEVPVAHPIDNTHDLDTVPGEQPPAWLDDVPEGPTVYVTLGTVHNRSRKVLGDILAGLGDLGVNVIATIGSHQDPADLGPQPPSVRIAAYVPLSLILPALDVVVTQGGTSILPSLGRGLPLLVVPQAADQFHNAEACLDAGVALRLLPDELGPGAARAAVDRLLGEHGFSERAGAVAREIATMPGPDQAVGLLERLARERAPVIREPER